MVLNKEALKAHLVEHYAARLDTLLEQVKADEVLALSTIEDWALQLRRGVGQEVTQALANYEGGKQAVDVACPECQQLMRFKGRKRRWLKTRSGEAQVERAYYFCEGCHRGHFPPG